MYVQYSIISVSIKDQKRQMKTVFSGHWYMLWLDWCVYLGKCLYTGRVHALSLRLTTTLRTRPDRTFCFYGHICLWYASLTPPQYTYVYEPVIGDTASLLVALDDYQNGTFVAFKLSIDKQRAYLLALICPVIRSGSSMNSEHKMPNYCPIKFWLKTVRRRRWRQSTTLASIIAFWCSFNLWKSLRFLES